MPDHLNHTQKAKKSLDLAMQDLNAEISAYPTPISGCDAQFNHLLAQRSKIRNALAALETDVFVPTPRMPSPSDMIESR